MNLNYRLLSPQSDAIRQPVVLIHGLFGSLDNLGILARALKDTRPVIQIDVRNHGNSPWDCDMNYIPMAEDILTTLNKLEVKNFDVIGHSMGGKIAMVLTALSPERLGQVVVIDIAPVAYQLRLHDAIFSALRAVSDIGITARSDAAGVMRSLIHDEATTQFLLKSFHRGQWRFNVDALWNNYETIMGWQPLPAWHSPVLFIRGAQSPYLEDKYRQTLLAQFPQARVHVVAGAGHWVHAEKSEAVLRAIHRYLET